MKRLYKIIAAATLVMVPMTASATNEVVGSIATQTNVSCTSGSVCTAVPFDQTNIHWHVRAENGAIRCTSGVPSGKTPNPNAPTANNGYEVPSGGEYDSNPYINPTLELDCFPETATTKISVWTDKK